MPVITEEKLRKLEKNGDLNNLKITSKDILTPSAREFLNNRKVEFIKGEEFSKELEKDKEEEKETEKSSKEIKCLLEFLYISINIKIFPIVFFPHCFLPDIPTIIQSES